VAGLPGSYGPVKGARKPEVRPYGVVKGDAERRLRGGPKESLAGVYERPHGPYHTFSQPGAAFS
jgi:hypothetical protein